LAATNRPTSRSRIGSDGKALQSSLRGDDSGCDWLMQHMLHKMCFRATYETRVKRMAEDLCCEKDLVL
jgi:hypothetical protein